MGGGVTTPISGHRVGMLHDYIIVIKTRMLFQLHLQLFHTPTLIYEPYSLLIPPAHGRQDHWPPILRHCKVKYFPRDNLMCHTDVVLEDILPNSLHPFVH